MALLREDGGLGGADLIGGVPTEEKQFVTHASTNLANEAIHDVDHHLGLGYGFVAEAGQVPVLRVHVDLVVGQRVAVRSKLTTVGHRAAEQVPDHMLNANTLALRRRIPGRCSDT